MAIKVCRHCLSYTEVYRAVNREGELNHAALHGANPLVHVYVCNQYLKFGKNPVLSIFLILDSCFDVDLR